MNQDKHYELVERNHVYVLPDRSTFDRLAYAMRVLDILEPSMKVVVYEAINDMCIERGRKHGHNSHWATVGIPKHASREHIAVGLAQLTGAVGRPWVIDVLLSA